MYMYLIKTIVDFRLEVFNVDVLIRTTDMLNIHFLINLEQSCLSVEVLFLPTALA